jgi:ABC-type nitrate/sulfonate/bicarbonate transport system permease component
MADTNGLKPIGIAFAIVTFAVVIATASVVANVDAERLDAQSTLAAR